MDGFLQHSPSLVNDGGYISELTPIKTVYSCKKKRLQNAFKQIILEGEKKTDLRKNLVQEIPFELSIN